MGKVKTYSTKDLSGKRVVGGSSGDKRIGKVERFVFHPHAKRCLGFTVKRPDMVLMFKRKDLFVAFDGFRMEDGRVAIDDQDKEAVGDGAFKRFDVDWDSCVLWEGMPLVTEGGEPWGTVGNIVFSAETGKVISITAHRGSTAKALLGESVIPSSLIAGFSLGVGAELTMGVENEDAEPVLGAILISDEVTRVPTEGGLAERAGQQTAIAQDKVRRGAAAAQAKAKQQAENVQQAAKKHVEAAQKTVSKTTRKAKPKVDEAVRSAGKAVGKGAFVAGRQVGRAQSMFSEFKKEYDKAVSDDSGKASRN